MWHYHNSLLLILWRKMCFCVYIYIYTVYILCVCVINNINLVQHKPIQVQIRTTVVDLQARVCSKIFIPVVTDRSKRLDGIIQILDLLNCPFLTCVWIHHRPTQEQFYLQRGESLREHMQLSLQSKVRLLCKRKIYIY